MLVVTFKKRIATGKWETMDTPKRLSDIIALAEKCIGEDVIVKLESSCTESYHCGNEEMMEIMNKNLAAGSKKRTMVDNLYDAHILLQEDPEAFCTCMQIFSAKEHVEKLFPPSPVQQEIPTKGWEHLRPKEEKEIYLVDGEAVYQNNLTDV